MRLLIDTHVLLALIERGARSLPEGVAGLLGDQESEHHLSAASLWEIAIKSRLGKLRLGALPELLEGLGVKIVAIDERHALAEVEPEPTTRDPFDRMLLAQCQVEGLKLITIDRALVSHPLAAKGQARGVARQRAAGRLAKSAH
jgi:PIN domain nuclease of toxin-antitoxin system